MSVRTSVRFRKKTHRRRHRKRQVGFTLIETLVIVVVIGVIAALAAPSFIGMMDSLRVDRTISEVRVALQSTQRQAIRGTKVCTVSLQMAPANPSSSGNLSSNTGSNSLNINVSSSTSSTNVGVSSSGVNVTTSSSNQSGSSSNGQGVGLATAPGQLSISVNRGSSSSSGSSSSTATTVSKNSISGTCLNSGAPDLPENVAMSTNIVGSNSSSSGIDIKYGVLGGAEFAIQDPNLSTTRDSSGKIVAFVPSQQNPKKKCIAVSSTLGLTRVGNYVGATDPASITQSGVCTALEWNKQ